MIYTVTTNPNIDYYMTLSRAPEFGTINRAARECCFPGGKGVNVSIMLTRLGVPSCALGFTAGYVGRMLEDMLRGEGCECGFVRLAEGETRINVKLTGRDETAFNGRGPDVDAAAAQRLLDRLDALCADDVLVLSGNVQGSADGLFSAAMEKANVSGAALVVDTEGDALRGALRFRPLLIKPNREELSALMGRPLDGTASVAAAARELQAEGARNVLVSMGADGALLFSEDGMCRLARTAAQGTVVSTVGAGDSMVAGYLAGLAQTGTAEAALRLGTAAGTATAFSPVLAPRETVERLLLQIEIQTL